MCVVQAVIHLYGFRITYMNALKCIHVLSFISLILKIGPTIALIRRISAFMFYSSRSIAPTMTVRSLLHFSILTI